MRAWIQCAVCAGVVALAAGCSSIRPPAGVEPVEQRLLVTGYCKCGDCCSWRRNWLGRPVFTSGPKAGKYKQIGQTASGAMVKHGTIAADTSLFPFGTIMYVDGYGYGEVQDTGGRVKGHHIDLYFYSHGEAREWGKQMQVVKVWLSPSGSQR